MTFEAPSMRFHALCETDARCQRPWVELYVARDVKAIWESASSETDKLGYWLLKSHTAAIGCTRCRSPHTDNVYPRGCRVAVGLRLGLSLCESHSRPCGSFGLLLGLCELHARSCEATAAFAGTHELYCNRSRDRSTRHLQINDTI